MPQGRLESFVGPASNNSCAHCLEGVIGPGSLHTVYSSLAPSSQAAKEAAAREAAKAAKKKAGAKAGPLKGGIKKAPIGKGKK